MHLCSEDLNLQRYEKLILFNHFYFFRVGPRVLWIIQPEK